MKTIPIHPNSTAYVDDQDYHLSKFKWYLLKNGNCQYARRKAYKDGKRVDILMHREIVDFRIVDHHDGNGLNNQRLNLRGCNNSQNSANAKIHKSNTSGFKGVGFQQNRWVGYIRVNGIKKHLGCFSSTESAAMAYDSAAREHFGEFANLNFPNK